MFYKRDLERVTWSLWVHSRSDNVEGEEGAGGADGAGDVECGELDSGAVRGARDVASVSHR